MWVTCYTDASFSAQDGAGWAIWLRSDLGRVVRRGRCPDYVRDSTAAELAAIFAAVYVACLTWPSSVRGVLVRSDCQGALALADPAARLSKDRHLRRLQDKLRSLLSERRIALRCAWVKGHQKTSQSVSAYLNNRCDVLANEVRRARCPRGV